MFNCAERNSLVKQSEQSPTDIVSTGDSVQTGSHDTFLCRFALSYGMTQRIGTEVLCVNMYIVTIDNVVNQQIIESSNCQIIKLFFYFFFSNELYSLSSFIISKARFTVGSFSLNTRQKAGFPQTSLAIDDLMWFFK